MKRRLTKLAVFLLLGAVVNVAVAWGCAWGASHQIRTPYHPTEDDTRWWYAHVPEDFPASPRGAQETHSFGFTETTMWEALDSPTFSRSWVRRIRAGLPVRALEGSIWGHYSKGQDRKIEVHLMKVLNDQPSVPFYPLLPGFTINTILYAAILWLPFAPFQLRRYIRIKRGHCIKCGYDLRSDLSSGCPECGWQREDEA